jgi:hypothetical protein
MVSLTVSSTLVQLNYDKTDQLMPRLRSWRSGALAGIQPYTVTASLLDFDSNYDSAGALMCLFELTTQKTCLLSLESFTNVPSIEPSRLLRRMDLRSAD